jgi:hypothetical protein
MPSDGQPTDVPDDALDARPTGPAGTPPGRDPEHPDAPGVEAEERTDLHPGATAEPDSPEGVAGP